MDVATALDSVSFPDLVEASGCSKSVVSRVMRARSLPTRGPNGPKLRSALERLTAGGSQLLDYKRRVDTRLQEEKLAATRRDNQARAGELVDIAEVQRRNKRAAAEFRRHAEQLVREMGGLEPERIAALRAGLERMREDVALALAGP